MNIAVPRTGDLCGAVSLCMAEESCGMLLVGHCHLLVDGSLARSHYPWIYGFLLEENPCLSVFSTDAEHW